MKVGAGIRSGLIDCLISFKPPCLPSKSSLTALPYNPARASNGKETPPPPVLVPPPKALVNVDVKPPVAPVNGFTPPVALEKAPPKGFVSPVLIACPKGLLAVANVLPVAPAVKPLKNGDTPGIFLLATVWKKLVNLGNLPPKPTALPRPPRAPPIAVPTPGISIATGATFLTTFFKLLPSFLRKPNSAIPVIGFMDIPPPTVY